MKPSKPPRRHPTARVVAYTLDIGASELSPAGKPVQVLTVSGTSPGPVSRFREGLLPYRYYAGPRWTWFAGYRADTMSGGVNGLDAGTIYRLPYFIDVTASQQSGGESRLAVAELRQLFDRLGLNLSLQHGRHTGTAGSAMLNYPLAKETPLTLGCNSGFGTGAGLTFRF